MYSVVNFPEEKSIEAVPSKWLTVLTGTTYCKWPSKWRLDKISRKIKQNIDPSNDWELVQCHEKYKCKSYDDARKKTRDLSFLTATEQSTDEEIVPETNTESSDLDSLPKSPTKKKRKTLSKQSSSKIIYSSDHDDECPSVVPAVSATAAEFESEITEHPGTSKHPENRTKRTVSKVHSIRPAIITDVQHSTAASTQLQEINEKLCEISAKLDSNKNLYIQSIHKLHKNVLDCIEEIKQLKKKETRKKILDSTAFPLLPLNSLENLDKFEEELEDRAEDLILYLSSFGTHQISTSVHSMMKQILTNDVAILYSMHGKAGKKKFMDLKLCYCVREAVLKLHKDKNVQPSDINKFIGLNLAYAKDRMAQRKKSSERQKDNSDDITS